MQEKEVKPGEIGTFKFIILAPNIFESKTYIEKFRLVANDLTLVEGQGVVTISINVEALPKPKMQEPKKEDFSKNFPYQAILVKQDFSDIKIEANKEISFEVKFKNVGQKNWRNDGENYLALNTTNPGERESVFVHSSWPYFFQPAKMQEKEVKPGEIGTFKFIILAPNIFESKTYIEKFRLVANDLTLVEGQGVVTISINVEGIPQLIDEINKFSKEACIFDPNNLISDSDFTNYNSMTVEEIQSFLEQNKSYLANYIIPTEEDVPFCFKGGKDSLKISQKNIGKKVSELIYLEAQEHQINPQVLLVTLQKESSVITLENMPNKWRHTWLLGYGYNESMAACTYSLNKAKSQAELGGVGNQITYAFWQFQQNFIKGIGPQINGITSKVGDKIILSNTNKEPLEVFLSNKATACLYRYTPHVYNGNYNFWKFYQNWFVKNSKIETISVDKIN